MKCSVFIRGFGPVKRVMDIEGYAIMEGGRFSQQREMVIFS
jgi:hypothetical protein